MRKAHEDHYGLGGTGLTPVDRLDLVSGNKGHRRGMLAMRERHTRVGRQPERCGDSGYDLKRNSSGTESLRLFPSSTEDEGVATLESHHGLALLGLLHQECADLFLRHLVLRTFLTDVDSLTRSGR